MSSRERQRGLHRAEERLHGHGAGAGWSEQLLAKDSGSHQNTEKPQSVLPRGLWRELGPAASLIPAQGDWFWASGLQNGMSINVRFKPPSL